MPYSSKVLENKSAKATIEKTKKRGKQGIIGDESKIKKPKISKNENIKISNTTNENEKKSANQNKQKSTKVEHEQLKECKLLDGKTIELTSDCVQLPERKRDPKQETPKYKVPLWRKNEFEDLENYSLYFCHYHSYFFYIKRTARLTLLASRGIYRIRFFSGEVCMINLR